MKEVLRSLGRDFLEQKQKLRSNELFHQFRSILYTFGHLSFRHVLQLHHDDGGEQCGVDCGGAQLSPQVGSTIAIQISPLNYHHRLLHIEQFGQILEIKLSYLISTITTGLRRPM